MTPAFSRLLARGGLLTLLLALPWAGGGQAQRADKQHFNEQHLGKGDLARLTQFSEQGRDTVPPAPAVSASAPAQLVFDEVNDLLTEEYGGLSQVNRAGLRQEYQLRLNAVCAAAPQNCPEEKAYPVIEAEITALNDPHSFFELPDEYKDFVTSATGGSRQQFGVKLARLDGENRLVLEVVPQGAAEAAGLRRGDVLETLDGQPYRYAELQQARQEGRAIRLGVKRQGQTLQISVQARESSTRDLPRLSFVGSQKDVALIRIPTFLTVRGVGQRVHDLVGQAQRAGVRGVVVDLRGNTGGSLAECDSAVTAFVPSFTRVAQEAGRQSRTTVSRGRRLEDGKLSGIIRNPQLWTGPMAVLVNEISASCSEFFAREIQYAGRGPIIGEPTAGVGNTATRMFEVGEGGAAVQLTVTHYVKPGGEVYPSSITPDQPSSEGEEELRRLSEGDDVMLALGVQALATAPTLASDRLR